MHNLLLVPSSLYQDPQEDCLQRQIIEKSQAELSRTIGQEHELEGGLKDKVLYTVVVVDSLTGEPAPEAAGGSPSFH